MFGDIGHGSIIMIIGTILTVFSDQLKKLNDPTVSRILLGKYLILMMGFFATYMGFIYNDFMSLPTRVFSSCYDIEGLTKAKSIGKKQASELYQ